MNVRPNVAVVGAGISGLTAAYILQKKYDVTLYESADRLGGHTDTHLMTDSAGQVQAVDTGFIVHNVHTYPNLLRMFDELGVKTDVTQMSMSITCHGCGLEYSGAKGYGGIFASPASVLRPRYLKLLLTVQKFYDAALKLVADGTDDTMTLGEFIKAGGYSPYFEKHFILPIVSAVWSCEFDQARDYPALYLFRFLNNHRMLQTKNLLGNTDWRVVHGGSNAYVKKIVPILHKIILKAEIKSITRQDGKVMVLNMDGSVANYDKIVIATHPDQALKLLAKPSALQRQLLGAFRYTNTTTLLHSDLSVLPHHKRAQASWNYLIPSCKTDNPSIRVSYDMNRLEHLDSPDRYIVSLDSVEQVDPKTVLKTMQYQHPLFTKESVEAQKSLSKLNDGTLAFAGAYHGWGFHEDGCLSGVQAARALGIDW